MIYILIVSGSADLHERKSNLTALKGDDRFGKCLSCICFHIFATYSGCLDSRIVYISYLVPAIRRLFYAGGGLMYYIILNRTPVTNQIIYPLSGFTSRPVGKRSRRCSMSNAQK